MLEDPDVQIIVRHVPLTVSWVMVPPVQLAVNDETLWQVSAAVTAGKIVANRRATNAMARRCFII